MSILEAKRTIPTPSAERRRDDAPGSDVLETLSEAQRRELSRLAEAGWQVKFVRNMNPAPAQLVVASPGGSRFAVIEADGSLKPFYNTRACDFS